MKKLAITLVAVLMGASFLSSAAEAPREEEILRGIREKMAESRAAVPSGDEGRAGCLYNIGLPSELRGVEKSLGEAISNNFDIAYSNFTVLATNDIDRMLFLGSGWYLGKKHYLECLNRNVDLTESGKISVKELNWYITGHDVAELLGFLPFNYRMPGVSNVVKKLMKVTGETQYYENILSGEASVELFEFLVETGIIKEDSGLADEWGKKR